MQFAKQTDKRSNHINFTHTVETKHQFTYKVIYLTQIFQNDRTIFSMNNNIYLFFINFAID